MFVAAGAPSPGAFLTTYPGTYHTLDLSLPLPSDDFLSSGPPPFCLGNQYLLMTAHAATGTQARRCAREHAASGVLAERACS